MAINPHDLPSRYASTGVGDCMVPLLRADATLAFDKDAPVTPGDLVGLWFTPEAAERIGIDGWVKRLASPLPPAGHVGLIEVEMLNPPRRMQLRSTDVVAVHKCIGEAQATGPDMARIASPVGLRGTVLPVPIETDAPAIALQIMDRPPTRTIVHAADDDSNAPLIRQGEIVVVDHDGTAGWYPVEGGLFLIEYVRPAQGYEPERRNRRIVQTFRNGQGRWYAGPLTRGPATLALCDGPYADDDALAARLLGPVIGIMPSVGRH